MKTETLRINELSPDVYREYLRYLQAMDDRDIDRYSTFLAEDCVLRMNNEPPVNGKAAIVGMLGQYWKTFQSIKHELLNVYGSDSAYVLEALNHYVRLDGGQITVRAAAFTDRNGEGQVTSVRLYTDVSGVFR